MPRAIPSNDLSAIARPFLWLSALAFVLGFAVGYLALGGPEAPATHRTVQPASVAAPASDAWNFPKHI